MSSPEEDSDNEDPATSVTYSNSDKPVIGPTLPAGPYRPKNVPPPPGPPPAPPTESALEPQTTLEQSENHTEANVPVAMPQVTVGPPGPPPMESDLEYEGATAEHITAVVKPRRSLKSPSSPLLKSEITLQKVRQKLYPSLRPQRLRESVDVPVLPLVALSVPVEVPCVIANNIIEEPKVPLAAAQEGVELISEYPPPSDVPNPPSRSSRAFDMSVIKSKLTKPSVEPAKQSAPQSTPESEACVRMLERHQIKFSVTPKEKNEDPFQSLVVTNQPKPQNTVARVELSTGESIQTVTNVSEKPGNSQENVKDDSRVEPETGAVETSITNQIPNPTKTSNEHESLSGLYQTRTPSLTEEKEGNEQFPTTAAQKESPEDGEMVSSESSADSESMSDSNEKERVTGKCYMDAEESKDKTKSKRSRSPGRKSSYRGHRRDYSDSDHDRYSDVEHRSRRHKSSKHSRRDYSSDESEERSSRRDRHRRSHRYDDSDDDQSQRRSSRSSYRSSKKNRSRSRSGHRRKRSYSKDSHSPHSSERTKKSPRHKKSKKKRKSHKSERKEKKEEIKEDDASKPPPNVIVGKVGRISSQRTLGKDKKPEDKLEAQTKPPATQQPRTTMSASYYQQPTTGEVPYYYYQGGYYDPSVYQQWGGQGQGQWYGQDGTQATSGTVQYPSQYTSGSQYASTTTTAAPHPVRTETAQSTPFESFSTARAQDSGTKVAVPSTEAGIENVDNKPQTSSLRVDSETGEAEPTCEESPQELPVVNIPPLPVEELQTVESSGWQAVSVDKPAASVVVSASPLGVVESKVENDAEHIVECDMEIEESTPSPPPQQPSIDLANDPSKTSVDEAPPVSVATSSSQENPLPVSLVASEPPPFQPPPPPPPPSQPPPPPSEASLVTVAPPTDSNPPSDAAANSSIEPPNGDTTAPSVDTPTSATPTSDVVATTTQDYSSYMLANQQQQAYSYAYATNNYVQAAYNAYVQQASAAAYQAYGTAGYYPGYGTQPATYASTYPAGYYGTTTTEATTPTSGGYGKVAYQLAQQAANTSTSDDSDVKKSEFTLAGNKSKQMKNMMTKWSSFKDDEDS